MNGKLGRLLSTTVGLKILMAVTGVVWVGFVIAHMTGNLLVYVGPEALDAYGHFLQEGTHGAIWIVRIIVAAALVAHVWAALKLARRSAEARPEGYVGGRVRQRASYAGLTMRYGGPALLLFILFHLSHLTLGWTHSDFVYGRVYHNVTTAFAEPAISAIYIAAMVFLGLHLFHGIRSGIQTVGLARVGARWPTQLATLVAVVVAGANISFPLAVLFGVLEVQ